MKREMEDKAEERRKPERKGRENQICERKKRD